MIRIAAFDLINTVFDISDRPREEVLDYAAHIKKPDYSQLFLPESWNYLWAQPGAVEGLKLIREEYMIVTCSNAPLGMTAIVSKVNDISWDAIVPIAELSRSFKPNRDTYRVILDTFNIKPNEMLMVTANPTFGDLEAAEELGINSMLIGPYSKNVKTMTDLYDWLKVIKPVFEEKPNFVYHCEIPSVD